MEIVWGPWVDDGRSRSCEGAYGDLVISVHDRKDKTVVVDGFWLGRNDGLSEAMRAKIDAAGKAHAEET